MHTGLVKWFSPAKGYGFITPDVGGPDVFLHVNELMRSRISSLQIHDGQKLVFETKANAKNPGKVMAANIKLVKPQ